MRCTNCRTVVAGNAEFCPRCGTALSVEAGAQAPPSDAGWAAPPSPWDAPSDPNAPGWGAPPTNPWEAQGPAPGWGAPSAAPSDPTAVMGRRIGAFFIDALIAGIVFAAIFGSMATERSVDETLALPGCHRNDTGTSVECDNRQIFVVNETVYEAGAGAFGLDVLFSFLYFGVLAGITGATVGKFATGIRIVKQRDGSIVGIPRSLLRWILFLVDGPLTLYICGLLTSLMSSGHRRLGDMAAGTYVVSKDAVAPRA